MLKEHSRLDRLKNDFRVGCFLAKRELMRANKWTTSLIIFVMMLTFLNLVVVSGILVGIISGAIDAYGNYIVGDIVISPLEKKTQIQHTPEIVEMVKNLPGYSNHVIRYIGGGVIESDYRKDSKPGEIRDKIPTNFYGIEPESERRFSPLADKMVAGDFLEEGDLDKVVVGSNLLKSFTPIDDPSFKQLKEAEVGSKVRIAVGDVSKEYLIKGVIKSKVDFDSGVLMLASEFRKLSGQDNLDASQISMHLTGKLEDSERGKSILINDGVSEWSRVQLLSEGIPKFVKDMEDTFAMLGAAISLIGLVVSSITIFIVIFVNAITRRRFIGILKGVGISNRAIEISYVLQAILYALIGSIVGLVIVYTLLKPGLAANPIDFPFADGVLDADLPDSILRAIILLISTIIAGFIPARMIVKQNTLSAILGR